MTARLRKLLDDLSESFWVLPALIVLAAVLTAFALVRLDRSDLLPRWLLEGWLYDGGATGARTLLGAVASSTIGVAGTVFSITIAALSLAAGQMGPRLLRNFTKDRGNQFTLGAFLGTFSYTLIVLRSVRTQDEGAFIPHLSLTVAIILAFVCVATLVYFVGHMAGRINVDTVIELVSDEVQSAIVRLTTEKPQADPPPNDFWSNGAAVDDSRQGYLLHIDDQGLADWATEHKTSIRMLVRPGHHVFPGAPIAVIVPPVEGAAAAIRNATALGQQRVSSADLEFAVRQLVEVAVRALSPGINDPHTAMSALDRLGAALCQMVPLKLPTGVVMRDGCPALVVPSIQYDGLLNVMFHMIRQNASANAVVLIRILDVLTAVVSAERDHTRMISLKVHADLVAGDARRNVSTPADLHDIERRHEAFLTTLRYGPLGAFQPLNDSRTI
ncbi:DUF2254 domain-containing protein [Bradyrhizobium betae]|uniref:DUF2254 domain-containing protein n=1 Tax=Bradyrhizobium betae TaxID=244734 RepID=UPI003D673AB6